MINLLSSRLCPPTWDANVFGKKETWGERRRGKRYLTERDIFTMILCMVSYIWHLAQLHHCPLFCNSLLLCFMICKMNITVTMFTGTQYSWSIQYSKSTTRLSPYSSNEKELMSFTADILRTNTGVINDGFSPLSVTASQVSEWACTAAELWNKLT